jgi:catechol 2,3-dioxygenase-like lactoylglutathione lyase family enzyme
VEADFSPSARILRRSANPWPSGLRRSDRSHNDRYEGDDDVIEGVAKLVVKVEDLDRALRFWTDAMAFELVQDTPYGEERWLEVRTPDRNAILVHALRQGEPPTAPDSLPTSHIFFYCDSLQRTYEDLSARGVEFPQPPVEQSFGWWSMFQDQEGNRLAAPMDSRPNRSLVGNDMLEATRRRSQ